MNLDDAIRAVAMVGPIDPTVPRLNRVPRLVAWQHHRHWVLTIDMLCDDEKPTGVRLGVATGQNAAYWWETHAIVLDVAKLPTMILELHRLVFDCVLYPTKRPETMLRVPMPTGFD